MQDIIQGTVTARDLDGVEYTSLNDCAVCRALRQMGFVANFHEVPADGINYTQVRVKRGKESAVYSLDRRAANITRQRGKRQRMAEKTGREYKGSNVGFPFTLTKKKGQ